jgi:hypothetical protein
VEWLWQRDTEFGEKPVPVAQYVIFMFVSIARRKTWVQRLQRVRNHQHWRCWFPTVLTYGFPYMGNRYIFSTLLSDRTTTPGRGTDSSVALSGDCDTAHDCHIRRRLRRHHDAVNVVVRVEQTRHFVSCLESVTWPAVWLLPIVIGNTMNRLLCITVYET